MSNAGAKTFGKYGIDPVSRALGIEPASFGEELGRKSDDAFGLDGEKGKDDALQGRDTEAAPKDDSIEDRVTQFATREQVSTRRASAAGATRSANDADLLGFVAPRRRSAARQVLG